MDSVTERAVLRETEGALSERAGRSLPVATAIVTSGARSGGTGRGGMAACLLPEREVPPPPPPLLCWCIMSMSSSRSESSSVLSVSYCARACRGRRRRRGVGRRAARIVCARCGERPQETSLPPRARHRRRARSSKDGEEWEGVVTGRHGTFELLGARYVRGRVAVDPRQPAAARAAVHVREAAAGRLVQRRAAGGGVVAELPAVRPAAAKGRATSDTTRPRPWCCGAAAGAGRGRGSEAQPAPLWETAGRVTRRWRSCC